MSIFTDRFLIWELTGKPGNIRTQNSYSNGSGYDLFCKTNREFLTYKSRSLGINLGYTNRRERKIHFRLPNRAEREILTGESIALGIGGSPSFLRYADRTVGINLKWSSSPKFEWRIYGDSGRKGERISTGSWIAIVNENVEPEPDFLVYFRRRIGVNLGWTSSPNLLNRLSDLVDF